MMRTARLNLIESAETLVTRSRVLLGLFALEKSAHVIKEVSEQKVLSYFHYVAEVVPAYKKFLSASGIKHEQIRTYADFCNIVPETDRKNYIQAYPLAERCRFGKLPLRGSFDESSGSTGQPIMWVRSSQEDADTVRFIRSSLRRNVPRYRLGGMIILNCWSVGPWATGIKFSQIMQNDAVVKSIGTNKVNAVETIRALGSDYDYLIAGYPPFTKEIIDYGEATGLRWEDHSVSLLTGGESFSESWREHILRRLGNSNALILSGYGASDLDIGIALEHRLCIEVKRELARDESLRVELLGDARMPAFLGQYNPIRFHAINNADGEFSFTVSAKNISSPKLKYNVHDAGKTIGYTDFCRRLSATRREILARYQCRLMKAPFLVVYGRSDGTISIDGANIYPANVQEALYATDIAELIDSFSIASKYAADHRTQFVIAIEAREGAIDAIKQVDTQRLQSIVVEHLCRVNGDYRETLAVDPAAARPEFEFHAYNSGGFAENRVRIKHRYVNSHG